MGCLAVNEFGNAGLACFLQEGLRGWAGGDGASFETCSAMWEGPETQLFPQQ